MTTLDEEFSSDSNDEDYVPGGIFLCIVGLLGCITH